MGSVSEDEECPFFDAPDINVPSISEANFDGIEAGFDSRPRFNNWVDGSLGYDVWNRSPMSVHERRSKFLKWMGMGLDRAPLANGNSLTVCRDWREGDGERWRDNSGAESSEFEDVFCSGRSSLSCWSNDDLEHSEMASKNSILYRDGGIHGECGRKIGDLKKSVRFAMPERLEEASSSLPSFQQMMEMEAERANIPLSTERRVNKRWLKKLRSAACIFDKHGKSRLVVHGDLSTGSRVPRMKVRHCKKQLKELSAMYMGQDIQAHQGAVLTMKFSPSGRFLATGGDDGIVKLWQVIEDERSNESDIPEIDPSCIYFTVNHLSELKPLRSEKEKIANSMALKKTSESACIIFPPKIFRILERPLHEFHGHTGDILDLSWSKNNYLLSSSIDKTVRLWRLGSNDCLKVFSHSNYVTCVHFNPMDENYFISGSIDGKIRIWGIPSSQVVDWIDIREIVTAVSYHPNGRRGVVGSINGTCRIFRVIGDNNLELDAEICLSSKKKSPSKKITGFQYSANDSSRIMVSSADSRIRIVQGLEVIQKYKGPCNTGNQMSASFTSDGKHIISASGDSNVYLWNCSYKNESIFSPVKKIKSYEYFPSNGSIAVPWCGLRSNTDDERRFSGTRRSSSDTFPLSSPAFFSLRQELLESFPKGSATWPEEKLHASSLLMKPSMMHKSRYKFLKLSCQNTLSSHAWGLVIVTAGWDGRIRSFYNYGLPVHV
ncbi:WD repeat-containing protein 44-like [Cucurbita pepo subsp. pepo]|uniref:WD repeat-containing protein 44-like n=1 Tax=Cucurbita pepo subsp. pepo TaxID=3664 RepID=UPI000C9D72A8|nr:WD repeat-containing protein 44-like [Cucurbita pepo subsp. pepo]XP_023522066.1 WD repeat-containing protein 44-like [Cucurbita pepo subsp. pepo]